VGSWAEAGAARSLYCYRLGHGAPGGQSTVAGERLGVFYQRLRHSGDVDCCRLATSRRHGEGHRRWGRRTELGLAILGGPYVPGGEIWKAQVDLLAVAFQARRVRDGRPGFDETVLRGFAVTVGWPARESTSHLSSWRG